MKLSEIHSEAMEVLSNINQALFIVQHGPFTPEVYDRINGPEGSLESLIGTRDCIDTMTPAQQTEVRRKIVDELREQEFRMLSAMRHYVGEFAADLESVMQKARVVNDHHDLLTLRFTHRVSDADFTRSAEADTVATNCFSVDAAKEAVEALGAATEFLNRIAPLLVRIYNEEQETVENPPDPDENNGQGEGHQVYTPFHTEETEDAITEVIAACDNNVSLSAAAHRLARGGYTLASLGYKTKADVLGTLEQFNNSKSEFFKAVRNVYNSMPNECEPLETFGKNSHSFYKAVEAVLGLINRADMVRDGMDASIETLTYLGK